MVSLHTNRTLTKVCVCVHTHTYEGQKRALDSLKL